MNEETSIKTDDPRVDILVSELIRLSPMFNNKTAPEKCRKILADLDTMKLSIAQKGEIIDIVRLNWQAAAQQAEANKTFSRRPIKESLQEQLKILCCSHVTLS